MAAAAVMQGSRGGVDIPSKDEDRVRSHLAKYYAKMDEEAPWTANQPRARAAPGGCQRSTLVPGSSRATGAPLGAAATVSIRVIRPRPLSLRIASWMA